MVCDTQLGLSGRIGSLRVQDNQTTFRDLRGMIEETEERGMIRRTVFYQELLHTMMTSYNPHGYVDAERRHYYFGVVTNEEGIDFSIFENSDKILMVQPDEEERKVAELMDSMLRQDVVLIPQSQISRVGKLSLVADETNDETLNAV
eukprot:CAMPEP_0113943304 /NCGR_PEP_ID=MMETSP1339-20121228/23175_1 /TAXON_ID=94617 /ORGANISM="Fibrocapsa japonica" /LENGTH=146 /DNA_ID=CAMNT_0000948145 /DNA_START=120 /DNA_END=560 /DNA_ORIENTATION=- /assembly_acc=CAM_ASM_000762